MVSHAPVRCGPVNLKIRDAAGAAPPQNDLRFSHGENLILDNNNKMKNEYNTIQAIQAVCSSCSSSGLPPLHVS